MPGVCGPMSHGKHSLRAMAANEPASAIAPRTQGLLSERCNFQGTADFHTKSLDVHFSVGPAPLCIIHLHKTAKKQKITMFVA